MLGTPLHWTAEITTAATLRETGCHALEFESDLRMLSALGFGRHRSEPGESFLHSL